MQRQVKVRLKSDLSRYHPGLVVGAEGLTIGAAGIWSRGTDRFVSVRFESCGVHDILWGQLAVVGEECLAAKEKRNDFLKTARNVVLVVGARGGFRHLRYEFTGADGVVNCSSTEFLKEAKELLVFFKAQGIEVKQEVSNNCLVTKIRG